MSAPRSDHLLNVTDILDRPAASRPLAADFSVPEGQMLPLVEVTDPLRLEGVLESVVDGILVRGTVSANLMVSCARCLSPIRDQVRAEVAELFSDPAKADDPEDIDPGYEIDEGQIGLDTLLRDALASALPLAPRCRPDCKGLCPTCGVNRNTTDCDCVEETRDPRWAALQGLRVDDEGTLQRPAGN